MVIILYVLIIINVNRNNLNVNGSKCKCTCNIVIFKELISMIAKNESSRDVNDGSPSIYAKQFAHKWSLRLMARFN